MFRRLSVACAVLLAILMVAVTTPLGVNLWFLATDPVYVMPAESSVFRFKPTVMNPGSGDWWLYGEDGLYYFAFTGEGRPPYRSITRARAAACEGFIATDVEAWCTGE